jgi:hypothetical protein
MIILKIIGWSLASLFVIFLWISSINLTKPYYNHTHHVWEEDPQSRLMSNIAIALIILTTYIVGYING